MKATQLTPDLLDAVADRFKVLAEPARLGVLNTLRKGPRHVSDLIEATGLNQANLSKHLQILHAHGFVSRRREGLFVYYALADKRVFALCDILCGQLRRNATARVTALRAVR